MLVPRLRTGAIPLDRFLDAAAPGVLWPGPLGVLCRPTDARPGAPARELSDLLLERPELGSERRDLGLPCLDNRRKPLNLRLELTQVPLAGQERVLRLTRSLVTAAVKAAGRAEDFPARRDVGRDHTVAAPEPHILSNPRHRKSPREVVDGLAAVALT